LGSSAIEEKKKKKKKKEEEEEKKKNSCTHLGYKPFCSLVCSVDRNMC
jgi:hypothetical protein